MGGRAPEVRVPGPMLHTARRVITDVDDFVDVHRSARTSPKPMRPGPIRAVLARADLGRILVEVSEYAFPIVTSGETLADRITVLAPLHRSLEGHLNGRALAPGVLHVFGPGTDVVGATRNSFTFAVLSFRASDLERAGRELDINVLLPWRGQSGAVRAPDWPRMRKVLDIVGLSERDGQAAPRRWPASDLERVLMELAARAFADSGDRQPPVPETSMNSLRIVRACERLGESRHFQDVTLTALCAVAGVSERRVRQAFYECFAMSPTAYLRLLALHAVRHELVHGWQARDAVSRAATDHGFWHLGRFAAQYRALFGETPSATVERRAQAGVA